MLRLLLAHVHHLAWASLMGTQIFESFVVVKVAYRHLPRSHFIELQRHMFPAYFQLQAALLGAIIVTAPLKSIFSDNIWTKGIPLVFASLSVAYNTLFEPRTSQAMMQAFGKQSNKRRENPEQLPEGDWICMNCVFAADKALDVSREHATSEHSSSNPAAKLFKWHHMMSIHVNAIAMIATACYGLSFVSTLES